MSGGPLVRLTYAACFTCRCSGSRALALNKYRAGEGKGSWVSEPCVIQTWLSEPWAGYYVAGSKAGLLLVVV